MISPRSRCVGFSGRREEGSFGCASPLRRQSGSCEGVTDAANIAQLLADPARRPGFQPGSGLKSRSPWPACFQRVIALAGNCKLLRTLRGTVEGHIIHTTPGKRPPQRFANHDRARGIRKMPLAPFLVFYLCEETAAVVTILHFLARSASLPAVWRIAGGAGSRPL